MFQLCLLPSPELYHWTSVTTLFLFPYSHTIQPAGSLERKKGMYGLQDAFSHPLYSTAAPSNRVLLQVKRRKSADDKLTYKVCILARVPITHEFSGLSDFQVSFVLFLHRVADAMVSHVVFVLLDSVQPFLCRCQHTQATISARNMPRVFLGVATSFPRCFVRRNGCLA